MLRGLKDDYLVIVIGLFFLFQHISICYRYSLEVPTT